MQAFSSHGSLKQRASVDYCLLKDLVQVSHSAGYLIPSIFSGNGMFPHQERPYLSHHICMQSHLQLEKKSKNTAFSVRVMYYHCVPLKDLVGSNKKLLIVTLVF